METPRIRAYAFDFIASVLLTVIPFGLVMASRFPRIGVVAGIAAAGTLQVLVPLRCFLAVRTLSDARWNILFLILTALIIILFVGGSIWIMHDLNYRMM